MVGEREILFFCKIFLILKFNKIVVHAQVVIFIYKRRIGVDVTLMIKGEAIISIILYHPIMIAFVKIHFNLECPIKYKKCYL